MQFYPLFFFWQFVKMITNFRIFLIYTDKIHSLPSKENRLLTVTNNYWYHINICFPKMQNSFIVWKYVVAISKTIFPTHSRHNFKKSVVKGYCTAPVNMIKFKINYSHSFRDVEKIEYVLNVCQFRWRESNYFVINHSWK